MPKIKSFSVDVIYYHRGVQYAYDIMVMGSKELRVSKEECFSLFKKYECSNAVLVNNSYVRGRDTKLPHKPYKVQSSKLHETDDDIILCTNQKVQG